MGEDATKEVIGQVARALIQERRVLTRHCEERMDERGVTMNDLSHALAHATEAVQQPNGTWRIAGVDRDDAPLVLVVDVRERIRIVTVM